jgi:hypothetical protein
MKKSFLMCLLLIATAQLIEAQTSAVTGSIKDEKGNPLHFVFVGDSEYKNAVFSDSLGNFTIAVKPDSKLEFELAGYENATISTDKNNAGPQIVLKAQGSAANTQGNVSTKLVETNSNELLPTLGDGGLIAPAHQKGNLRGNRYLFDNFAHGFVINSDNELIHNPGYLFDYDKMGGILLVTKDKKNITEVSWDKTKSFTLYNNTDQCFVFEKAPAIDNSHYVQVLASGKKYKIYKLIKTKFVRSDFVNNGVTSHGNDYDEYVDDADYYVLDVQGNQSQKLSLKKKSIKEDFAKDADKVNKYLSDNSGSIDDTYLSKLGAYMNQ